MFLLAFRLISGQLQDISFHDVLRPLYPDSHNLSRFRHMIALLRTGSFARRGMPHVKKYDNNNRQSFNLLIPARNNTLQAHKAHDSGACANQYVVRDQLASKAVLLP
jgi:hypothetical protein